MEAKELMIGDWVEHIVVGEQSRNHPMKVDLRDLYRIQAAISNSDDSLIVRPIPLTEEILEKNGFEVTRNMSSSRNKDVWSLHVSKYKMFHIVEHHNKKMFPYFWIEIGSNSDIKYVHQLQHALRLCGIDKTIEL